jgi:acyl carrier protein
MGLDSVELVMDVERHFGINIKLTEASRIATVGDLVALVEQRLVAAREPRCHSLAAFYELRSSVRKILGEPCFRFRPSTAITDCLSKAQRRELWSQLGQQQELALYNLVLPEQTRTLLQLTFWLIFMVFFYLCTAINGMYLILGIIVMPFLAWALAYFSEPWRTIPPSQYQTMGHLAKEIAGTKTATKLLHLQSTDEIFGEVRQIIVQNLGVKPQQVKLQTNFARDLGVD